MGALSPAAHAAVSRCDVQQPGATGIVWVIFDSQTRKAAVQRMGETAQGRVVLSREHAPYGYKYNLVFNDTLSGGDATALLEVLIFPVGKSKYRVAAVTTTVVDGKRYLDTNVGNFEATCQVTIR